MAHERHVAAAVIMEKILAVVEPLDRVSVLGRERLFEHFAVRAVCKPRLPLAGPLPFDTPFKVLADVVRHFGRIETLDLLAAGFNVARH